MPDPPEAFSALATIRSSFSLARSAGANSLTQTTPGRPTISPMKRTRIAPTYRFARWERRLSVPLGQHGWRQSGQILVVSSPHRFQLCLLVRRRGQVVLLVRIGLQIEEFLVSLRFRWIDDVLPALTPDPFYTRNRVVGVE